MEKDYAGPCFFRPQPPARPGFKETHPPRHSPAAAAAAGLPCATGGFMGGSAGARRWGPRILRGLGTGVVQTCVPLWPSPLRAASRSGRPLARPRSSHAAAGTARSPSLSPGRRRPPAATSYSRGRGRAGAGPREPGRRVCPRRRASTPPSPLPGHRAPPSPRARRGTAVTPSRPSPGYSPKYLPAASPARPDDGPPRTWLWRHPQNPKHRVCGCASLPVPLSSSSLSFLVCEREMPGPQALLRRIEQPGAVEDPDPGGSRRGPSRAFPPHCSQGP